MSNNIKNIHKLNKKIDSSGYFEGINLIEKEEFKFTSLMLILGILLIIFSLSSPNNYLILYLFSVVSFVIGGLLCYKSFSQWDICINELLAKRVSEKDTQLLIQLSHNGEETKKVVSKIISGHKDGFLSYQSIANHMEELVVVYNKERSFQLNKLFNENFGVKNES